MKRQGLRSLSYRSDHYVKAFSPHLMDDELGIVGFVFYTLGKLAKTVESRDRIVESLR